MPRPHALTETKRNELCSLVAAGLPLRDAARHVGCHVRTIRREQEYDDDFRRAFNDAELAARLEPERLLRQAAATHWRAAAWLLDRTRRRSPRLAPSASLPDDLQALGETLIEAALGLVNDSEARRAAYDHLTEISAGAMRDILATGGHALRRRTATPWSDSMKLDRQLDAYAPAQWRRTGDPLAAARRASRAKSDKTNQSPRAHSQQQPG